MFKVSLSCLLVTVSLYANGIFVPHPPHPPHPPSRPVPSRKPISVKDVLLDVTITDQAAVTRVEEVFVNPNTTQLEGTFVLPIPKDANIDRFSFFINGKEVKGEMLSSKKAAQVYRDIVARMIDPAILEYADKGLIRVKMFPIPPKGEAKIRFSYSQVLASEGGQLRYYYPFGTNKFSSKPLSKAVVDVKITSQVPLRAIYAPNYPVDIARDGEKRARVSFEKERFLPRDDFLLYVGRSEEDFGLTAVTFRRSGSDGYFLFAVSPKQRFGSSEIVAKDIVFVLDTSGSMAGGKLDQAKEALCYCIKSLSGKDRFNLVSFSTTARMFKPKLQEAGGAQRKEALSFIEATQPIGGTNIDEALQLALKQRDAGADRPFMVVFLTDGKPTVGITDVKKILKRVGETRPEGLRLFVFGVGYNVNTHLLDRLAGDNRGTRNYVLPDENLEVRVSSFYRQIAYPVLSDVEISFGEGGIHDMYPPVIHDIFHGRQLLLVGRYSQPGENVVTISGKSGKKHYSYRFPVALKGGSREADYLPRVWASRKIGYLLDEIRLHGGKKELEDEVKALAQKYGIVTPYTSYLVQDDTALARRTPAADPAAPHHPLVLGGGGSAKGADSGPAEQSVSRRSGANSAPGTGAFGARNRAESGKRAVSESIQAARLKKAGSAPTADSAEAAGQSRVRSIGSKTFYLRKDSAGGTEFWVDSVFTDGMTEKKIPYLSDEYFALLADKPELGRYLALGKNVVVCVDGVAYRVVEEV